MNGKAEGRWLGAPPCDNEKTIEDKRTPSLRGGVIGADITGPAVVSRYNSTELGKFLLPKRDLLAFWEAGKHCAAVVGVDTS